MVSTSVALLLAGAFSTKLAGWVTVAVLLSVPVAPAGRFPVTVYVALPPTSRLSVVLMLPKPLAVQLDPGDAAHVHVTPVSTAGSVSVTLLPIASSGPLLVTLITYVPG